MSLRQLFTRNADAFRRRQAAALSRRLFPNTNLRLKDVAYAIGAHPDSIGNWLRGHTTLDGPSIEALDQFFVGAGDYGFIAELFGDLAVRRLMKADALEREAAEMRASAAGIKGRVA